MANTKRTCAILSVLAVVLLFGLTSADAQLAKKGSYAGVYGWHFPTAGQLIELEKDHVIAGGTISGVFRSDAGEGFLHEASVVCTISSEFNKGSLDHASGDCVMTDQAGDKAFGRWKCTACPATPPTAGDFQWTGGTGKYTGLKARNSYKEQAVVAGPTGLVGWSAWKGEWELP